MTVQQPAAAALETIIMVVRLTRKAVLAATAADMAQTLGQQVL